MSNKKVIFPLFLSLVLVLPLYTYAAARIGGWSRITDVKNPHVVAIGKFAVSEYDKRTKLGLKFVTVVSGETQVVSGTNYRLIVAATGGASNNYEAVVWEKPWLKSMNLTSFKNAP